MMVGPDGKVAAGVPDLRLVVNHRAVPVRVDVADASAHRVGLALVQSTETLQALAHPQMADVVGEGDFAEITVLGVAAEHGRHSAVVARGECKSAVVVGEHHVRDRELALGQLLADEGLLFARARPSRSPAEGSCWLIHSPGCCTNHSQCSAGRPASHGRERVRPALRSPMRWSYNPRQAQRRLAWSIRAHCDRATRRRGRRY